MNLFCLPFAGGSKYSYTDYQKHARDKLNLISVELPGRGTRFKEKLLQDASQAVDDILRQIQPVLQEPYAIYGHSMGGLLAFLTLKKIIEANLPRPLHLFVSGCGGPATLESKREEKYHELTKEDFLAKVKEMGGMPDEVLQCDELMVFFEPILRSDFKIVEMYRYSQSAPFDVPISVFFGSEEETKYEDARLWQQETTGELKIREFPGKHFFIFSFSEEIVKDIIHTLNQKITNERTAVIS
ncbi:thioesterase domain-containing protein [Flavitalea sp. BT771]|uniref:thioesterase II family protein n=1 Tax=Flavitalea sp. BT771 TaxID=3063329 RepID=UPI0026E48A61|nr:thioesterase domain-containing protein [Flavitalea sp. BT771]MDO6435729.1 thioesterase domain-containing protein [Flavitalea sp. BT771]MDV6224618.1 thioesterase domain-containing protein [Flavitalea sp. BT771]